MDDSDLLRQFLDQRSDAAFAALVRNHIDLVYSAARRQMREPAAAEDVTQQVFILLARKANTIRSGESVTGWLLVTTRFVAINALRAEARRRRHEREAAAMKQQAQNEGGEPAWEDISSLLDDGVAKLRREDRDALALRYFQGRSISDVGAAMGISTAAAQKRVSRAVAKLRERLVARGVAVSSDGLTSMLTVNAIVLAPAALTASATSAASAVAASATGSSLTAGKGVVALMAMAKTKVIAAAVCGVLLIGVTGTIAYQELSGPGRRTRQVRVDPADLAPVPAKVAPAAPTNWEQHFREVYGLKDGEIVKHVGPRFIPERIGYYRSALGEQQFNAIPNGPDMMRIQDDGKTFANSNAMFGGPPDVLWSARFALGIESWNLEGPGKLINAPMRGDWVVRADSTPEQRQAAFVAELSRVLKTPVTLTESRTQRQAIVVRGKLAMRPIAATRPDGRPTVVIYRGKRSPNNEWNTGNTLGEQLADTCNLPVIDEAGISQKQIELVRSQNSWLGRGAMTPQRQKAIDEILGNVAAQTSLDLRVESRLLPVWTLAAGTK